MERGRKGERREGGRDEIDGRKWDQTKEKVMLSYVRDNSSVIMAFPNATKSFLPISGGPCWSCDNCCLPKCLYTRYEEISKLDTLYDLRHRRD